MREELAGTEQAGYPSDLIFFIPTSLTPLGSKQDQPFDLWPCTSGQRFLAGISLCGIKCHDTALTCHWYTMNYQNMPDWNITWILIWQISSTCCPYQCNVRYRGEFRSWLSLAHHCFCFQSASIKNTLQKWRNSVLQTRCSWNKLHYLRRGMMVWYRNRHVERSRVHFLHPE